MEKSANWIFYDARNPDDQEFGHNTYHPDCQLRAWSKALDLDYRRLAIWLNLPDPDRTLNGKYVPYFRTSDRTDSVDKRKMDKYIAMNNQLRTTAEFPGLYSWGTSFGRYVKSWKCRGYVGHEFDEELEDLDMWCEEHQHGTYVVVVDCSSKRMGKDILHAVAVIDGKFYDTWDSGYGIVIGWFEINTNKIMLDKKPKNASKKGNFFRKIKENREMKKKYTAKQITEAIAYWKKQLNESTGFEDKTDPMSGKEFIQVIKKAIKNKNSTCEFRMANPKSGNGTQLLTLDEYNYDCFEKNDGILYLGKTDGTTIGNKEPFTTRPLKGLKDFCQKSGKKLSQLISKFKGIGLQLFKKDALVIVGYRFEGDSVIFYVRNLKDGNAISGNENSDDWI